MRTPIVCRSTAQKALHSGFPVCPLEYAITRNAYYIILYTISNRGINFVKRNVYFIKIKYNIFSEQVIC